MEKVGQAYAFFDCDGSKEQIERELPDIRAEARTPAGLRLKLYEGISGMKLDAKLLEALKFPYDYRILSSDQIRLAEEELRPLSDARYALMAQGKGRNNESVAGELADIFNAVHRRFNFDTGYFRGAVTYEKDGEYYLRE